MERLLPKAIVYSAFIFACLLLTAPLVPHVLGKNYALSVVALRWLALLPVIRTIHSFYSDALTAAGRQGLRMTLQLFVALFNIGINLWLIPAYSWRGAVISSLISDVLLAVLVVTAIAIVRRAESPLALASTVV
jgi:O-antigen/teichoic acid export membrane protein